MMTPVDFAQGANAVTKNWCVGLVVAVLVGVVSATHAAVGTSSPPPQPLRVTVDPRVELVSIVFRLAGNPEFSVAGVPAYAADVDAYFGRFRTHRTIERARELCRTREIAYNAPVQLALYLTAPPELAERAPLDPLPPRMDPRWTPAEARAFAEDLRAFARDTHFGAFLAAHDSLYRETADRLDRMVRDKGVVEWLHGFFGRRDDQQLILTPGLLLGRGNFGIATHPSGHPVEIAAILGVVDVDATGTPVFEADRLPTIVHEFSHPFASPFVKAHLGELLPAAEKLYAAVREQLQAQAYGSAEAVLHESLVRACSVRYLAEREGAEAGRAWADHEASRGFYWVGQLADLLAEYERDRAKYATLDAFAPRLAAFFERYSRVAGDEIAAYEAQARQRRAAPVADRPRVLSLSPANGAEDVDAATVTSLRIEFDRPMRKGFAFVEIPGLVAPKVTGAPQLDATHRVLTLPCALQPGTAYGIQLNSEQFQAFADEQGHPLAPLAYRFRTRK